MFGRERKTRQPSGGLRGRNGQLAGGVVTHRVELSVRYKCLYDVDFQNCQNIGKVKFAYYGTFKNSLSTHSVAFAEHNKVLMLQF